MADSFRTPHICSIQLAAVQLFHGRYIVECVIPSGVTGLNMKIGGIIQHQQGLPVLGAGLGTFSIERQRKFLIGVPVNIHAHRHSFIGHLHKVGVRFRLVQLCRFKHWHKLIQPLHKLGCFLGGFIRFVLVHDILEPFAYTAGISASECGSQFMQCVLTAICIVTVLIRVIIESELVDVCCQLLDRVPLRLRGGSQVNAALLADFLVVALDVVNQLAGSLVDSLQTGPQLLQLLVLRPGSDVAKTVLAGLDAEILTDRIGNALGLYFLGVAVLGGLFHRRQIFLHLQPPLKPILVHKAPAFLGGGLFRLCLGGEVQTEVMLGAALAHHHDLPGRFRFILFGVVELTVRGLMDSGGNGLHLAHAFPDGDPLLLRGEIAVHVLGHRLKLDGNRSRAAQSFHESLIVRHRPGQAGGQLWQGLSVRLAHIEHLHRTEHGDFNFFFLHDRLAIRVQDGCMSIRVALHFLDLLFVGRGGNDGDTMLTLFHMALKLVFPLVEPGHQGSVRALHIDKHGVVDRISVELGHDGQIAHILLALKQLLDTLFNARRDLLQPFPVGGLISHEFHSPFQIGNF